MKEVRCSFILQTKYEDDRKIIEILDNIKEKTGLTKSNIIRKALLKLIEDPKIELTRNK